MIPEKLRFGKGFFGVLKAFQKSPGIGRGMGGKMIPPGRAREVTLRRVKSPVRRFTRLDNKNNAPVGK